MLQKCEIKEGTILFRFDGFQCQTNKARSSDLSSLLFTMIFGV